MLKNLIEYPIHIEMKPDSVVSSILCVGLAVVQGFTNVFIWSKIIQYLAHAVKLGLQ
jgi:hypothetical protein